MKQRRRSVWQWLADKAGVQARLTRDEWLSAFRLGAATIIAKPGYMSTGEYRDMLNEQASAVYARLLGPRPTELVQPPSAAHAPLERQTGPTRPVNPEQLQKLIGTQTLPAIPGELARKYRHYQREQANE